MDSNLVERNIIGMMLFDNKIAEKCVEELKLSDFDNDNYKNIFFAAQDIYSHNLIIDLIGIATKIEKMNIQQIDLNFIREIVMEIDTTVTIDNRIKDMKNQAYCKKVFNYSQQLSNAALNGEILKVSNLVSNPPEIIEGKKEKTTDVLMQEASDRMVERYHAAEATVAGNETGFKILDNTTGGIKDSELIAITAEPNVGKSILAHQIGINIAKKKNHVLSFNFEMTEAQIGDRTTSIAIPFDIKKLKSPKQYLTQKDVDGLNNCPLQKLLGEYLHIYTDTSNKTPGYIKSHCKKIQAKYGKISLIIVDYLQLMSGEGEDWEVSGKNFSALKDIAKEFNCPVITIASLDKAGKVRGSGQIDFDADQKWHITRIHDAATIEERSKTELKVMKNRDGGKGILNFTFEEKYIRFSES